MAVCNSVFYTFAVLFFVCVSSTPIDDIALPIKIPAECKGQPFCSIRPEGYDLLEEEISNALPEFLSKGANDVDDRFGDIPSDEPRLSPEEDWHNCPSVTRTQSMFLYNHGGNDTKIDIFVQTKMFRQFVEVVNCATDHINTGSDEQCFQDLGVSAFGMKSLCETTTAKRTLYVYDIERKKVVQKYFEVPACCTCKVSYKQW